MIYAEQKPRIATIAAQINTCGEGRAVLGRTTELLSQGYDRLPDITSSDGSIFSFNEDGARASAKSLLDQANDYAQRVYASIPSGNLDAPLAPAIKNQVAAALQSALRALSTVETAAEVDYWDYFGSLSEVLSDVGSAAGSVTAPISSGLLTLIWTAIKGAWPLLLVVALLLYLYGRARSS